MSPAAETRLLNQSIHTPPHLDRLIVHQFDPQNPVPGGIDTCLRGLIRYHPDGLAIGVIGVAAGQTGQSDRVGKWERISFRGRTVWFLPAVALDPANQSRKIPHSMRLIIGVIKNIRKIPKARIVQAHRMDTALAITLLRRSSLHYFVHTQENGLTGKNSDSIWKYASRLHAYLEHRVIRKADNVAVFNPDYAEVVRTLNPSARSFPTWWDPENLPARSPERHSNDIVWIGRLEPPKDPILAIRAFAVLLGSAYANEKWTLSIIGSGTLEQKVAEEVSSLPDELRARIKLHGRLDPTAVSRKLASAGVFLMTSHAGYEGFPRVLVEAMAAGCQPVVTPGCDTGRLLERGVNGIESDGRSPDSVAAAVRAVLPVNREAVVGTVHRFSAPNVVGELLR